MLSSFLSCSVSRGPSAPRQHNGPTGPYLAMASRACEQCGIHDVEVCEFANRTVCMECAVKINLYWNLVDERSKLLLEKKMYLDKIVEIDTRVCTINAETHKIVVDALDHDVNPSEQ
jgi:hypothetical protein